ncbi:MAG: hypothetical protein IJL31_00145 [Oscillospiraceae bacterium]|nr:hypothetical protein [Oscillospiraceae bacterium]MBQ6243193.1 hypothetical protein [Bacteroidales bacterium]
MTLKIKIKNSIVHVGALAEGSLLRDIAEFDLADKTPLDCMDFIRKLKQRYGTKKKRSAAAGL